MILALQALGHEVPFQDPTAPVEIFFAQPEFWEWSNPNAYHIGYLPWESTALRRGWKERMNSVDEVWTPSPVIAQWYKDAGVTAPIRVYEHGVDSKVWTKKRRRPKNKIRFLHVGEPAPRKGGILALEAFRTAFGDREDVHLTIKAHDYNTALGPENRHPNRCYNNVTVITSEYPIEQLVDLHHRHDVLVYPSYGEGFGLIPLQAMVTGMPVVCTEAWAPYKGFLLPDLRLKSTLSESPWSQMHPGKMFHPKFQHLVEIYKEVAANYPHHSASAYRVAYDVEKHYNWVRLTEETFAPIVTKFS